MLGVSGIIAIVLILMIAVVMVGITFVFFSDTFSQTSTSASSTSDTLSNELTSDMVIESMAANTVYVRNTGTTDLSGFTVLLNEESAKFSMTPTVLKPGETGAITIYDYVKQDDKIRVYTQYGYAYTYADPCRAAVSCWHLDENSGSVAYDSKSKSNATIYTRRENLIRYSQDFSNAAWGGYCGAKNNIVYNTSDVLAPDGTLTATRWLMDSTITCSGNSRGVLQYASPVLTNGENYTASVWLRGQNGGELVYMGFSDGQMSAFYLTTSWKRYFYKNTYNSSYSRGMQFFSSTANAIYYVWGAQVEKGNVVGLYSKSTSTIVNDSWVAYSGQFPSPWVSGNTRGGIQFDGTYYMKAGCFTSLGTSNTPYTIEGWIKAEAGETDGNIIHMSSDAGGAGWCLPPIALSGGKIRGYSWNNGAVEVLSTTTIVPGVWYRFANTWDPERGLRIFINGVLEGTTSMPLYTASGASNYLWTAFSPTGCSGDKGWFNGTVDEVRIYNKALY